MRASISQGDPALDLLKTGGMLRLRDFVAAISIGPRNAVAPHTGRRCRASGARPLSASRCAGSRNAQTPEAAFSVAPDDRVSAYSLCPFFDKQMTEDVARHVIDGGPTSTASASLE